MTKISKYLYESKIRINGNERITCHVKIHKNQSNLHHPIDSKRYLQNKKKNFVCETEKKKFIVKIYFDVDSRKLEDWYVSFMQ